MPDNDKTMKIEGGISTTNKYGAMKGSVDLFDDRDDRIDYKYFQEIKSGNSFSSEDLGNASSFYIEKNAMDQILASNNIFSHKNIEWYTKFNRYGYVDPFDGYSGMREFLFFTKPDLNIFGDGVDDDASNTSYENLTLNKALQSNATFIDAEKRYKKVLTQLQHVKGENNRKSPFMCLLSNAVKSNLELPSIQANTNDTSSTIYGANIQVRSHSLKSDNGYDFTLSFQDTKYLEIYELAKVYDEYERLLRTGMIAPKEKYILNQIYSDQFSVYKFLVNMDDGETIMFAAKVTGVFFTDVPRSEFSDITDNIKFSLSFHGQFVGDDMLAVISDFNRITAHYTDEDAIMNISNFNDTLISVDNSWVSMPFIQKTTSDMRKNIGLGDTVYKLKWGDYVADRTDKMHKANEYFSNNGLIT